MKYLQNFGEGWGMWNGNDVVNFIDNHDNQRGHGGGGGVITHTEPRVYKVGLQVETISCVLCHCVYRTQKLKSETRTASVLKQDPNT